MWHCRCSCGKETDVATGNLNRLSVASCGHPNDSMGERNIKKILQNNNILYETEKAFDDLINPDTKRHPRYDFYLPEYHRLIEFDGKQHYANTKSGWFSTGLEDRQNRDQVKNKYALSHNIDLVRIPYTKRDTMVLEDLLGDEYLVK